MMTNEALKTRLHSLLPHAELEEGAEYLTAFIPAANLHALAQQLRNNRETLFDFLICQTGMDWGDSLGVVYHLSSTSLHHTLVLKVKCEDREHPALDTVCDIWRTAEYHEREIYDLLGIKFHNHPDMRRLFLDEDWIGYPLRKDYDANPDLNTFKEYNTPIEETPASLSDDLSEQEYVINMGPQHPSTHGVLHLVLKLKGEMVESIVPNCGYIHRGIEKMSESLTYAQIVHLTDRMDYLSAHINNEALCLCVEKALQIEVPERVKYIRTIMDELTRIASHQLFWATFAMDLGGLTAFFYGMRDREKILDIFEESCGGRLIVSYNTPGGLMNDIHPNFQQRVKEFIEYFRKKLPEYAKLLTGNVIFEQRTKGVGVLSTADAISYGVTGPSARASGFSCDVRKHHPYGVYEKVKFKEIIRTDGDCYGRYMVRMEEMYESMNIIEQLIDNIPEGDYTVKMKPVIKLPEGEFFQRVETARGELDVYIVSKGEKTPYRIKFRSPNFSNMFTLTTLAKDQKIADLVAIGGSLDYIIPDIDR